MKHWKWPHWPHYSTKGKSKSKYDAYYGVVKPLKPPTAKTQQNKRFGQHSATDSHWPKVRRRVHRRCAVPGAAQRIRSGRRVVVNANRAGELQEPWLSYPTPATVTESVEGLDRLPVPTSAPRLGNGAGETDGVAVLPRRSGVDHPQPRRF